MSTKKPKSTGKRKTGAEKREYDPAWKSVIKRLFQYFLEFFFPDIYQAIDFTKEIHFLDKELSEIDPDSNVGDRIADVLVKVRLKNGSTTYLFIIIHIEVQGERRTNFMERMFIYFYRAFDKERTKKVPVISAAILTDDDEKYRPDEYSFKLLGFELRMRIPIVKTIDYKLKKELIEKLETSKNPMVMVVKAQLKSHEVKHADNDTKFEVTKELIRQCYKNGYSREDTHLMLTFFERVIRLPDAFEDRITKVIKQAEEEFKMEYIPTWEKNAHKTGEKRGIKKGTNKEKIRTAKVMIEKGFDIDTIIDITGLDKKEIEKLSSKSH